MEPEDSGFEGCEEEGEPDCEVREFERECVWDGWRDGGVWRGRRE